MYKGYCTPTEVAAYMGVTFNMAQQGLAAIAIEAAEDAIDRETGHAWLESSPVTEVLYNPQTIFLHLKGAPILSITSVTVEGVAGCETWPLQSFQYDVHSLEDGRVYSPLTWHVYKVTVVYEVDPLAPVPADIHMAAMTLASHNMRLSPSLMDGVDPNVVQRYVVGGELEVEFRRTLATSSGSSGMPQQVLDYIDAWRKNYVVI